MSLVIEAFDNLDHDYMLKRLVVESTTTADVLSLFKNLLPKSTELIRSYLPSLTSLSEGTAGSSTNKHLRQALMQKVGSVSFIAYEDTLVFVPEGFKGKLVPYLELLLAQSKVVLSHGKQVLVDYNLELSMFLANEDIRSSMKSHAQTYKRVRQEREGYHGAIQAFFDKKNPTLSRRKISDVIERFSDLDKIFVLEQKLEGIRKEQNYHDIISEVQKAADMLALIKGRLDNGDIGSVSGQVARNLAEGAYEVAKYAEYMALYGYFVETALMSIRYTAEQLEQIFGK